MSNLDEKLYYAVVRENFGEVIELLGRGASVNYKYGYDRATPLHQAAVRGNVEVADLLIRNSADVNAFDQNRATPLHQAAERGNVEVADLLIRNSADVNAFDQNGDTPLHETATVEVADLLTRNSADVNAIDNNRATPLHQAAKRVNVEVADLLIRNSADVNAFDQNGDTPLHQGINSYWNSGNNLVMVENLIRLGANVSVSNNEGFTPLHSAANRGSVEVTDLLIRNKADVNAPDNDGATPLHNAAKGGHVEVSDLLIRNKAGVNTSDNDGSTPLHAAAIRGNVEVTNLLIRNKTDVDAHDNVGDTPLHKAIDLYQSNYNHKDMLIMVENLIHLGADTSVSNNKGKTPLDLLEDKCKTAHWYITNEEGNSPLHQAASSGKENMVKALIGLGANVAAVNMEGNSSLHQAASSGKENVVKALIGLGANVAAVNMEGNSPLHQAASSGKENVVKALIGLGANVAAVNMEGNSPLHQAASSGKENVVKALIGLGANVEAVNMEGRTPLHDAVITGNINLTDLLIRNNADVNATDNVGKTPLHDAAIQGNIKLTDLLIRNNADMKATDNMGRTPLHDAAMKGNTKLTDLLIRNNAEVNATDNVGKTPLVLLEENCQIVHQYKKDDKGESGLHQSASKGEDNVAKDYVSLGADVSAVDNKGDSRLHQAASKGQDNVVKYLVNLGDDVSAVNNEGNSPLHMAVIYKKENIVTTLITLGADPSARNNEGKTPIDIAEDIYAQKKNGIHEYKCRMMLNVLKENSHNLDRTRQQSRVIANTKAPTKETMASPTTMQSKKSEEKDIQLPWLVDGEEFQRMLSQGTFLSYENRLSLGGPCRAGKSTLASVLIGEKIPLQWNSTDGLVIYFGRNGIDIYQKKMVPLKKGDRGHDVLAKILRGKPDVFNKSKPRELDQRETLVSRNTSKNQNENNTSKSLNTDMPMHNSVTRTTTNEFANQTHTSVAKSNLQVESTELAGKYMSAVRNDIQTLECQRLKLQSDILDEVRTGQYKIEIAPSDLIDFGGQKSYDMTHQLFIQHKGSFLLMFDGRFGLHNQLEDYPEGVNAASILKHWVDSILTYTADTDEIMPMILFAATHRDMCEGDTTKMKECFLTDIKEMFSSHEKNNHIHLDTIYFINGVDKNDVEIQRMTDQIVIFAMRQTSWGQRIPMQWVPLELQISNLTMKNINILTKANLQQVNVLNADLALNEKQMDDFLLVQHSLGKLMYYNLPGLDKFIIIHPPALVNILRSFVTDEKFFPEDENLKYILQQLTRTGKIYKTDLLKLWEQEHFNKFMPEIATKEFAIQLLIHLDILIIPKSLKSNNSKTEIYLVPCMIQAMKPPNFYSYNMQENKTICLRYSLDSQSLPTALAFKLIGAVISVWPVKEDNDKICLYHKAVVLNVVGNNELRVWIEDNRIFLHMTNQNALISISPDIAASVQECLTWNLELSILFMYNSIGKPIEATQVLQMYSMEVGIPCGNSVCYRSVRDDMHEKNWVCNNGEKHTTKHISYWIFDRKQENCNSKCEET